MESVGCLRWLLMLVPMSLLTALGLGALDNGGSVPVPPTPYQDTFDSAFYYTSQDGTLQLPYLEGWVVVENTPGIISVTNAPDWNTAVNNQQLQSGEFVITIFTTQALSNFGANPYAGVGPVIDYFKQIQSPDAIYREPIPLLIGGRDALRVDIVNPSLPTDIRFFAYALQPDRAVVLSLQTWSGEGPLFESVVEGMMERMSYLGDPYYGFATPTFYDGATLSYPTPYPTDYYTPTPIATAVGAFTVQIDSVEAAGDLDNEAVVLKFTDNALMENWALRDANNATFYVFPSMLVFEGASIYVYTGTGSDTPISLYAGYGDAHWQSGSTIYLYDSSNRLMDTFVVP